MFTTMLYFFRNMKSHIKYNFIILKEFEKTLYKWMFGAP